MIIHLPYNQIALIDRGLAWIKLHNDNIPPDLTFMINAGIHTKEEIKSEIIQMLGRINEILGDILKNTQEDPKVR